MNNELPRTTPESQGMPSAAIERFVRAIEQVKDPHSFMLLRHGAVIAEGWWRPYRPEAAQALWSLSKSFTSTAVGLAAAEGRLTLEDTVLSFFPEDAPRKISDNLAAMKVRHLLSMTTGHDQDVTDQTLGRRDRNSAHAFLSLPVEHAPGMHFVYNSAASFMLSAIVQKLTGKTLLDYLTPRLFEPLGIRSATWDSYPNYGGVWINFGGWGLSATTEGIARFGQLYLQKGMWNGQQILPTAWVEEATTNQVPNDPASDHDWGQGYGYHFWRCQPAEVYRGDGAFGQFCIVMPVQDAVLAITAGAMDMQAILKVVWKELLPSMGAGPLRADEAACRGLGRALAELELPPAKGPDSSPLADHLSGQTYVFGQNDEGLQSLSFDFAGGKVVYERVAGRRKRRGKHSFAYGRGIWVDGVAALGAPEPAKVAVSGAWQSEDTFVLTLCWYESSFVATLTCRFEADRLYLNYRTNVGFGPVERPQLVGRQM